MDAKERSEPHTTTVKRASDCEMVVTRTFDAPARVVYKAWTTAELFKQWWAPKSMGVPILACEMDVRVGGGYRLTFGHTPEESMTFHGKYIDVVPNARIVWTNEEDPNGAVTTVTFEEKNGKTLLVMHERYPSKEALDASFEGMESCMPEQCGQLDELLLRGIAA